MSFSYTSIHAPIVHCKAEICISKSENQKYSKITYIMSENTHVVLVTNTVLKEDYKMGCNLFQV